MTTVGGNKGKNNIGFENDAIDYAILALIVVTLLSTLFGIRSFSDIKSRFIDPVTRVLSDLPALIDRIPGFKTFLIVLSLLFVAGIVFCIIKLYEISKKEHEHYKAIDIKKIEMAGHKARWEIIAKHMKFENPAEWRAAILEADAMLDEMLREMGYVGESVSERLKSAGTKELRSIESAWEAHKVRNVIAHEGSRFELNKQEARRVIALYERVFRDANYL